MAHDYSDFLVRLAEEAPEGDEHGAILAQGAQALPTELDGKLRLLTACQLAMWQQEAAGASAEALKDDYDVVRRLRDEFLPGRS